MFHQYAARLNCSRNISVLAGGILLGGLLTACSGGGGSDEAAVEEGAYLSFWQEQLAAKYATDSAIAAPVSGGGVINELDAGYSATNVQVLGVEEPTELLFDGSMVLHLTKGIHYIDPATNPVASDENGAPPMVRLFTEFMLEGDEAENPLFHYSAEPDYQYYGLLSHDNRVGLIAGKADCGYIYSPPLVADALASIYCPENSEQPSVVIKFWPYKEGPIPQTPNVTKVDIDGAYIDARAIEDKLYIVTRFQPHIEGLVRYPNDQDDIEANRQTITGLTMADISPTIQVGDSAKDQLAAPCHFFEELSSSGSLPAILMVTQIDIHNPQQFETLCVADNVYQTFVSNDSLYMLKNVYGNQQSGVTVHKIAFGNQGLDYRGFGQVAGSLPYDRYFLGEVDGRFAIVNTRYASSAEERDSNPLFNGQSFYHQLSLLQDTGEGLSVAAQIPSEDKPQAIGKPGESIYAVRFMNERAYIVTFERLDPLYVIDLSDSSDPVIAGEVEIPGFSEYLHVVGDDLLVGVGYNAVSEGNVWLQGINVRLFDVSDPSEPVVLDSLNYGQRGSFSRLFSDPHALAYRLDETTAIARLAFTARLHGDEEPDPDLPAQHYYDWTESVLLQLEVDTQARTLSEVARYTYASPELGATVWGAGERAILNQDRIYFSYDETLEVLNWGGDAPLRSFVIQN